MSIGFIVYSDYLCPWCFNAFVRLTEIEEEYGSKVDFDWRCYLLRPDPRAPNADGLALEKFRVPSVTCDIEISRSEKFVR